jgi:hypothetical protein
MMVGVAAQDREGAVELLEQHHADQAVGQGDAPEPDRAAGAPAQIVRVAVGPADGEGDRPAAAVLLLTAEQAGQLLAADLLAALIERDEQRILRQGAEDPRLVFDLLDRQAAIRPQPPRVLRLGGAEVVFF